MNAATQTWSCPQCLRKYILKAGTPPVRCPRCEQRYDEAPMPPRPRWMQEHAERKSAFVPASSPRQFSEPDPVQVVAPTPVRQRRRRRDVPFVLWLYIAWAVLMAIVFSTSDLQPADERLRLFVASVTLLPAMFALYMLPTLIASSRGHNNAIPIGVVNLFFGWTMVGYVGSLAWSLTAQGRTQ